MNMKNDELGLNLNTQAKTEEEKCCNWLGPVS